MLPAPAELVERNLSDVGEKIAKIRRFFAIFLRFSPKCSPKWRIGGRIRGVRGVTQRASGTVGCVRAAGGRSPQLPSTGPCAVDHPGPGGPLLLDWVAERLEERLNRGLTDNPQLRHFFGVRKYLRGELNSPLVERLNKGSTAAWSPT
eukprot:1712868-Pyramimonas_sp.AAC.1